MKAFRQITSSQQGMRSPLKVAAVTGSW